MHPALLLKSYASSVLADHLPSLHDAFARSTHHVSTYVRDGVVMHDFSKRELSEGEHIAFIILIPVLVILSGVFAGLTLGYMSLDETQLNVLSTSGSPKQREYAQKIMPIRKNGHLLLVTLLLANMIVNETLPVISDPVLGGGVPAVVVSTVLIVIFSEIIPQSICTRHGLLVGAKMAGLTQILIYVFAIVAWPVAKFLEFILGPHHGIIYRRGELKELIALHSSSNPAGVGGDLRKDTVTIIGATLDLQDKTVRHAMTPIDQVFMLHIDSRLDYDTLRRICSTGHSRIPVYEEVEVNVPAAVAIAAHEMGSGDDTLSKQEVTSMRKSLDNGGTVKTRVKRIVGILLVKQCVLLDPEDAVPVRRMRLNRVPFVPQNEPLLGILDRFQEGRSHMAIVSRLSKEKAKSVKKAVHKNLTQRLLGALGGDTSSDSSDASDDDEDDENTAVSSEKRDQSVRDDVEDVDNESGTEEAKPDNRKWRRKHKRRFRRRTSKQEDLEKGDKKAEDVRDKEKVQMSAREQTMPADAVLSKENAEEYLASQAIDPSIMPLGIITLEDVLEELIGEEIYDEFDVEGEGAHSEAFVPPGAHPHQTQNASRHGRTLERKNSMPELHAQGEKPLIKKPSDASPSPTPPASGQRTLGGLAMPRPIAIPNLKNLGFLRSRSAPPTPRNAPKVIPAPDNANSESQPPPDDAITPSREPSDSTSQYTIVPPVNTDIDSRALEKITEGSTTGGSPSSDTPLDVPKVTVVDEADATSEPAIPSPPVHLSPPALTSAKTTPVPGYPAMNTGLLSKTGTPRSGSPAPSLEAVLLDRKRRGLQGVGSPAMGNTSSSSSGTDRAAGISAPPVGASPSTGESTRGRTRGGFKSSPLSPHSAADSGVIAEEIRKQMAREREAKDKEDN